MLEFFFFFSSRRRHTIFDCDWSSDVCSSDLVTSGLLGPGDVVTWEARHFGVRQRLTVKITAFDRPQDRKSTRLNSSHSQISYAVFCLKKKKNDHLNRLEQSSTIVTDQYIDNP